MTLQQRFDFVAGLLRSSPFEIFSNYLLSVQKLLGFYFGNDDDWLLNGFAAFVVSEILQKEPSWNIDAEIFNRLETKSAIHALEMRQNNLVFFCHHYVNLTI